MVRKKGELNISFGMIFSIILIVAFLFFAFYAVQKFLAFQHDATVAKFYEHLENDVAEVWTSTQASDEFSYIVPGSIEKVCFKGGPGDNVILYENGGPTPGRHINHLDINSLLCIDASNGRVSFLLEKKYGEALVNVSRVRN